MTSVSRWTAGAAALFLLWAMPAAAQNCTISTTSLAFGTYDVFAAGPTDSTAVVSVRCNRDLAITIFVDRGGSTTFSQRLMITTGDQIGYNLYLDAAHSLVWGDGTEATSFYVGTAPRNVSMDVTVYGRVPGGQDVSAGSYTDTVVATVNF